MSVNRRQFLKGVAAGSMATAVTVGAPDPAEALQRAPKPRVPEGLGLLYDSTLCVGCKACVAACKAANDMPVEIPPELRAWDSGTWDAAKGLSGNTLNVIKVYMNGTAEEKDHAQDGFAFVKRQCLHCVDPSCVSCCPVSAMIKDPVTGIVSHDPDRCIGCRYCVYACPFEVPKYQLDDAFGRIEKCQLCRHLLAKGGMPACAEHCPTGATLFGPVDELIEEGHRRLALKPGDRYQYRRGSLSEKYGAEQPPHEKVVEVAYLPELYGEHILGGTQALYLSAVPFDRLGLPYGDDIPKVAYAAVTEGVQHTLYKGMVAPAVVLAGLAILAHRNMTQHRAEIEQEQEAEGSGRQEKEGEQ